MERVDHIKKIIEYAAAYMKITPEDILSDVRQRKFVTTRMYLSVYLMSLGYTSVEVGNATERDHSTILYQKKRMTDLIEVYKIHKDEYNGLISFIDICERNSKQ